MNCKWNVQCPKTKGHTSYFLLISLDNKNISPRISATTCSDVYRMPGTTSPKIVTEGTSPQRFLSPSNWCYSSSGYWFNITLPRTVFNSLNTWLQTALAGVVQSVDRLNLEVPSDTKEHARIVLELPDNITVHQNSLLSISISYLPSENMWQENHK